MRTAYSQLSPRLRVPCASVGRRRRATLAYEQTWRHPQNRKYSTPSEEDRATAIGNTHKKSGEDRTCSSEHMIVYRQTHTHTHTHTLINNTPLHYRGRSNKRLYHAAASRPAFSSVACPVMGVQPCICLHAYTPTSSELRRTVIYSTFNKCNFRRKKNQNSICQYG